jgi:hypothetical protein
VDGSDVATILKNKTVEEILNAWSAELEDNVNVSGAIKGGTASSDVPFPVLLAVHQAGNRSFEVG